MEISIMNLNIENLYVLDGKYAIIGMLTKARWDEGEELRRHNRKDIEDFLKIALVLMSNIIPAPTDERHSDLTNEEEATMKHTAINEIRKIAHEFTRRMIDTMGDIENRLRMLSKGMP